MRLARKAAEQYEPVATVEPKTLATTTPPEKTFAALYQQVHDPAMRRFEPVVGHDEAAEALQKAAVELYERWGELLPEQKTVATFMTAIAYRVRDGIRARRANSADVPLDNPIDEDEVVDEALQVPDVSIAFEAFELERLVNQVSMTLPRQCRRVWVLYKDGIPKREIAAILDVHESTVLRHLERARRDLRKAVVRAGYRISSTTALKLLPRQTGEATNE